MKKLRIDLSPGGDGAGNQTSIEVSGADAGHRHVRGERHDDPAVRREGASHGNDDGHRARSRSSEPSLKTEPAAEVPLPLALDGLRPRGRQLEHRLLVAAGRRRGGVAVAVRHDHVRHDHGRRRGSRARTRLVFTVPASVVRRRGVHGLRAGTSATAPGSPHSGKNPTANHKYKTTGDYVVRVAATDDLGHTTVTTQTVHITV